MSVRKGVFLFLIAAGVLIADAWLKAYVHLNIFPMSISFPVYPYGGIGVFRDWHGIDFSIIHVMNKGAAWGTFSSLQDVLLCVRIAIIGGLLSYLFFVKATEYRKRCLTLVTAGAIGNVIDYFVYGHVVDMFYFKLFGYSYPVFNIADSAIFIGIVFLLLESGVEKIRAVKKVPCK